MGKDVVDIGCGGGIYSRGFAALNARSVIGIDSSPQYIAEAGAGALDAGRLTFRLGTAADTALADESADLVFERALIHHLTTEEKIANAGEARRLLRSDGMLVVQDRTLEDVQASEPRYWIRATLFETFPRLLEFERARRPSRQHYAALLEKAGFGSVRQCSFDEVRRTYDSFAQLGDEIRSRKGKSILFQLSDEELEVYCDRLRSKAEDHPLIERDPWTVWLASK